MTRRRKLSWIAALYFAEGLPFGIAKEVWPIYFRVHDVSLTEIGLLSLLGLPWTLKVIWSPLVDRFGSRQQWITACLLVLGAIAALTPLFEPSALGVGLWLLLFGFTLASATQDVAIDAYTIGLVDRGEEGEANGIRVSAYRIALIASGGGMVVVATWLGWPMMFVIAAAVFWTLAIVSWNAPGIIVPVAERRAWLAAMKRWLLRPGVVGVVIFILIYKLGDAAMGPMVKPFWLARGFTPAEIGLVSTSVGMLATIAGALLGGYLTSRWGIFHGLWVLGLAQALSNLGYALVAWADPAPPATAVASVWEMGAALRDPARLMVYGASLLESFTGGLGSAAFLAFLMNVCEKEHAAVQYAALSAIFALSRDLAGAASGWATTELGYANYFLLTFALAFPAFACLPSVRQWIREKDG